MKKSLKISLRILLAIIALLILSIILIPLMFKDQIKNKVLEEANKNLNAKVAIADFGLSLFRSFPDFSLTLNNMYIAGVDDFSKDTLIKAEKIYVRIDLMSVFKGEKYEVEAIELKNANLKFKVLKSGKANWDIAKASADTTKKAAPEKASSFKVGLQKLVLENVNVDYSDASLGFAMNMNGLNHTLTGDLTEKYTTLRTKTLAAKATMSYGGVSYLKDAQIDMVADIEFDMEKFKFIFKENELKINDLTFGADGFFTMMDNGYDMDLKFKVKKAEFKSFLSLIPGAFTKDFENIQTSGNLQFDGFVKGQYTETKMPAFALNLKIDNARFKYPDLPKSVENINIDTKINNSDGNPDKTVIDIRKFHFEMGGNPMDITMHVATPVSDPAIKGTIKGRMDLASVKDFYPLTEGDKLSGIFTANLSLNGKMSSIEKEKYEEFEAKGTLEVKALDYVSKDMPKGAKINELLLNFSPKFVSLDKFSAKVNSSDFNANGRLDNFLGYFLRNEMLKGSFNLTSNLINVDEFMGEETTTSTSDTASAPMSVVEVPGNIDFTMTTKIAKLIYDKMDITNVEGSLKVADKTVDLSNMKMNLLDGSMIMSGKYATKTDNPYVDFILDMQNIDVKKSCDAFEIIKTYAPIAAKCVGKVSMKIDFDTYLDNTMMPNYKTLNGFGSLKTSNIAFKGINTFDKIATVTKMDKFKNLEFKDLNLAFEFKNGRIELKPFDLKIDQMTGKMQGYSSFDQSINYVMDMIIPTKVMGAQTMAFANSLVGEVNKKAGTNASVGDKLDLQVLITGTVTDPQIKTGIKGQMNDAVDDLKNKAKEEADKLKAEAEAKARAEADKLKAEAEARVKAETDKLKSEADKAKADAEAKVKAAADKAKADAEAAKKKAEEDAKKKAKDAINKNNPFKK